VLEIHYATTFVVLRVLDVPLRVTPSVKPAGLYEFSTAPRRAVRLDLT